MHRILVLNWQGASLAAHVEKSLKSQGHEVSRLEVSPGSDLDDVMDGILDFEPTYCLNLNFDVFQAWDRDGVELEKFLSFEEIPLAVWWLQNPIAFGRVFCVDQIFFGNFSKNLRFFFPNQFLVDLFRSKDYQAFPLYFGLPSEALRPNASAEKIYDLTYFGNPLYKATYVPSEQEFRSDIVFRVLDEFSWRMRNLGVNYILPSMAEMQEDQFRELLRALSEPVREWLLKDYDSVEIYDSAFYAYLASCQRIVGDELMRGILNSVGAMDRIYSFLQTFRCLKSFEKSGIQVSLGEDWAAYFEPEYSWISKERLGHGRAEVLSKSRLSLCAPRFDLRDGMEVKVLEALAQGSLPLVPWSSGVERYFQKDEVVTYRNLEELKHIAAHYLKNEAERSEIVRRAQSRIAAEHGLDHRMMQLNQIMSETFAQA